MSYIESSLMSGENVIYRAKLHWSMYIWPAVLGIIGLTMGLPMLFAGAEGAAMGFGILVLASLPTLFAWLRQYSSEFAVTNKRIVLKVGLIRRDTVEMLLTKVEGAGVDQGFIGRMLNYGTLRITGTGAMQKAFKLIADPMEFRKHINEQIDASTRPQQV